MNPESQPVEPAKNGQMVPAPMPSAHLRRMARRAPASAGPAASTGGGLTPAFFWQVFCKSWMWVIPAGLILSAGAGVAVWWLHVPKYQARAVIKIDADIPYIAFEPGRGVKDVDRFIQTQIQTMQNEIVLAPLALHPQVSQIEAVKSKPDPVKYFQENLRVQQIGKSELFLISFESDSAADAATIVNSLLEIYLKKLFDEEKGRKDFVISELERARKARQSKIEEHQRNVVKLAKQLTGRDPFGQGAITDSAVAYSPAAALFQELTSVEVESEVVKAEIAALKAVSHIVAERAQSSGLLDLEVSNRSDVRLLEMRLMDLEEQIGYIKRKPRTKIGETWENDPDYLRLSELVTKTRAELDTLKGTVRTELIALRQEQQKAERDSRLAAKEQELAMLAEKHKALVIKRDALYKDLQAGGEHSAELEFAKSELASEQRVLNSIADRVLTFQTEKDAPPRVKVESEARAPSVSIEPIPYKLLLISCLAMLVAPFGAAVGREVIVRRVRDGEQLAREVELPLLGEVSRLPTRRVDTRRQLLAPQQRELLVYTESIDSLRTTLALTEQVGVAGQTKIVAVCSAVSGEGKTNIATSLGMSISQASNRATLVIDADLRDPDVANYLDVPTKPGLAEVLAGKATISEAIYRVGETRTFVMPAGEGRANPHRVLEGNKVHELLETLRSKFGTIVIDTPPVLAASEALVYAKAADLVVFCSLAEVSRTRHARIAAERLESTGANVAGAVISGVSQQAYVYRYGNYQVQPEN